MKSVNEYVSAVDRLLPRWFPNREAHMDELRRHLLDRVAGGETEADVLGEQEPPAVLARGLVEGIPLDPAPLGARVCAFVVDVLVSVPLTLLLITVTIGLLDLVTGLGLIDVWLSFVSGAASDPFVLLVISFGLLALTVGVASLSYFPLAEWLWGTTIGKRAFDLAVVAQDGTRLGLGAALIRRLPFLFEFFWLDALFALFGSRHQRAFDRVARSLVIRRPGRALRMTELTSPA